MSRAVVSVVTAGAGTSASVATATAGSTASVANVAVLTRLSGAVGVTVLADTVIGGLGSVVRGTCGLIAESCNGSWLVPDVKATLLRLSNTLLRSGEGVTSTTATSSGSRGILDGGFGTSVTLAGALDGLVHDLGRRLGFPVRVELRVVACTWSWLERSSGDQRLIFRYPGARKDSASRHWVSKWSLKAMEQVLKALLQLQLLIGAFNDCAHGAGSDIPCWPQKSF